MARQTGARASLEELWDRGRSSADRTTRPEVTGGELAEHLSEMGTQALVEAAALFDTNGLEPHAQEQARATYAPKLHARDGTSAGRPRAGHTPHPRRSTPGRGVTELDGREIKLFGAPGRGGPRRAGRSPADGRRITDHDGRGGGAGGGSPARGQGAHGQRGVGPRRGAQAGQRFE